YQHLGGFETSDAWARRAIEMGERTGMHFGVAGGNEFLAENRMVSGPWDEGVQYARRGIEAARRLHSREREGWSVFALGACLARSGDLAPGIELTRASIALGEQVGEVRLLALALANLATFVADTGDLDEAEAIAEDAFRRAEALGHFLMRCEGRRA